jgi:two-component system, LytTR family, response regulator
MKCIAIDDEPLALDLIEDFCSRIEYLNLVKTFTSAIEAMDFIKNESIDLIFVDIKMPRITGIDFVKSMLQPPIIIFTTAFTEYALTGFDLNAVDYLVKPIPFDRFFKAVNKANEIFTSRNKKPLSNTILEKSNTNDFIIVNVEYCTVKINLKDIKYIEGVKDYVKIVVENKTKSILTRITMKKIIEKLPSKEFIRVHRSFIVSLSKIEKIERNRIVFGEKRIPISEQYKVNFYNIIDSNRI